MENETANETEIEPVVQAHPSTPPTFSLHLNPLTATAAEVAFVLNLLGITISSEQYAAFPPTGRNYFKPNA